MDIAAVRHGAGGFEAAEHHQHHQGRGGKILFNTRKRTFTDEYKYFHINERYV